MTAQRKAILKFIAIQALVLLVALATLAALAEARDAHTGSRAPVAEARVTEQGA